MPLDLMPHQKARYDRLMKFPREVLAKYIVYSAVFVISFDAIEALNDAKKIGELKALFAERNRRIDRMSPALRERIHSGQVKRSDGPFLRRMFWITKRLKTLERWLKRTYTGGKRHAS